MEFEENKPTSDEDRRRAESKRLTLQPVHADITPEPLSPSESAVRYDNAPAVANITSETEEMTSVMQPTKSLVGAESKSALQTRKLLIGLITSVVVFTSLTVIALLK